MAPAVPQEIIDAIIEELIDCSQALETCSLVSRSFLDASRRAFLSRRAISIQPTAQDINQLIAFLTAPHNSCYIYDLRIHYRHCDNDWWAATLPPLLASLDSLHSISICEHGVDGLINWDNVSPAVQTALLETFRSTNLKHVRLYGVENFPVTRFSSMTQLETLVCADCNFNPEGDSPLSECPESLVRGYLQSLLVYNPRSSASLNALVEVFESPNSGLRISQLKNLLVHGCAADLTDGARTAMRASSESLETFTWWLEALQPKDPMPPPNTIDLQIMKNLHTIYLTTDYPELHEHDPLLWLINALKFPSGLEQLQDLTIFVRASVEDPRTLVINSEIWAELHRALTLPGHSNLRSVRVVFTNRPRGRDVKFVLANMPDLHDNGVLQVESGMNEIWGKFLEVYKWKGGVKSSFVPIS